MSSAELYYLSLPHTVDELLDDDSRADPAKRPFELLHTPDRVSRTA